MPIARQQLLLLLSRRLSRSEGQPSLLTGAHAHAHAHAQADRQSPARIADHLAERILYGAQ